MPTAAPAGILCCCPCSAATWCRATWRAASRSSFCRRTSAGNAKHAAHIAVASYSPALRGFCHSETIRCSPTGSSHRKQVSSALKMACQNAWSPWCSATWARVKEASLMVLLYQGGGHLSGSSPRRPRGALITGPPGVVDERRPASPRRKAVPRRRAVQ